MKANRRELRSVGQDLTEEERSHYSLGTLVLKCAPSTEAQMLLQSFWAQARDISGTESAIGADDNFFQLGDDSTIAIKLLSLSRAAGVSMTLVDILGFPRVANAAALISTNRNGSNGSYVPFQPFSQLEQVFRTGIHCHERLQSTLLYLQ